MLLWILIVLGIYLVNLYAGAAATLPSEGVLSRLGSRAKVTDPEGLAYRLTRAASNLQENLVIFLPLALLALILGEVDLPRAILGAQIFAIARIAYIPAYALGVPGLRSACYFAGLAGLVVMVLALVPAL